MSEDTLARMFWGRVERGALAWATSSRNNGAQWRLRALPVLESKPVAHYVALQDRNRIAS